MFDKFLFLILIILIFNFIHCETLKDYCSQLSDDVYDILCLDVIKQNLTKLKNTKQFELTNDEINNFININEEEKLEFLDNLSKNIPQYLSGLTISEKISEYLSIFECNKDNEIEKYKDCIEAKKEIMNITYNFILNFNISKNLFIKKKKDFDFTIMDLYLKFLFYSLNSPEAFSSITIPIFFDIINKLINFNDEILKLIEEDDLYDFFALEINIFSNSFNLKNFSELQNIFITNKDTNLKDINNFFYTNNFLQEYIKKITSLNKKLFEKNINIQTHYIYYMPIFISDSDTSNIEISNYTIGTINLPNKYLKSNIEKYKGIGIFIFNNFLIFNINSIHNKIIFPTIVSMKIFDDNNDELNITHIPLDAYYTINFERDQNKKFKYCYEYFPNENIAKVDDIKTENFDDKFINCRPKHFGNFFIGQIDMKGDILISNSQVIQIIFILFISFALVVLTGFIMIKMVFKSTNLDIKFQDDNFNASLGIRFDN